MIYMILAITAGLFAYGSFRCWQHYRHRLIFSTIRRADVKALHQRRASCTASVLAQCNKAATGHVALRAVAWHELCSVDAGLNISEVQYE
ncbi:hypothetical protein [Pantoea dispersa]|uniref:hypothetical protein n=1 Tax=Pantoea dispersa TaxID=59814 RepID=UPI0028638A14|nr:hypothetical protein [Pantoea dispersa]MDR6297883.1 hypothetical protein [Pantoea dispersa]